VSRWYLAPPSLLNAAIRWRLREFVHLATNRDALLDRVAVVSMCWAFRRLAKQYRGGRMSTTVNGDYADAEPVLYDVVPYFGSRNNNGFDEVEIYADVSSTTRRAIYWHENELQARDDAAYDAAHPPAVKAYPQRPTLCHECGVESIGGLCEPCIVMGQAF
jgi:hypothetical protein